MTELSSITFCRSTAPPEAELRQALRRFIEGRLRDPAESEDLVQETYLRLYAYRRTRSVADVGAFCFAVARNLINDYRRRLRAAPATDLLVEEVVCPQPRADEILAYRERVEVLLQALRRMPPLRREVFTRRRLDGIDAATIAADLELSRVAVDNHVSRALADLRDALERRGLGLETSP